VSIDSRPSDAPRSSLCACDCPIFVEEDVLKMSKSQAGAQDRHSKTKSFAGFLENLPDEDLGRYKM
jgi:bifunctional DNase/RNase